LKYSWKIAQADDDNIKEVPNVKNYCRHSPLRMPEVILGFTFV
jgi:hypothetical protein